jgi:hypothetical protein
MVAGGGHLLSFRIGQCMLEPSESGNMREKEEGVQQSFYEEFSSPALTS